MRFKKDPTVAIEKSLRAKYRYKRYKNRTAVPKEERRLNSGSKEDREIFERSYLRRHPEHEERSICWCWCGELFNHDYEGKDEGLPHPRPEPHPRQEPIEQDRYIPLNPKTLERVDMKDWDERGFDSPFHKLKKEKKNG